MKPIYACLIGLCGVAVVLVVVPVSAERLPVGIGVSEHHEVHPEWFQGNRFIHKVGESSMPDNSYGGRRDPETRYQRRQDQPSGNNIGNSDINLPDSGGNRTMSPSADVPNSVQGGGPNPLPTFPDARPGPEGDPAVRDLGGSGLSAPSAPPGSLGR